MKRFLLLVFLCSAVSACGGGGGGGASVPSRLPTTAPNGPGTQAKFVLSIQRASAQAVRRPALITANTATIVLSVTSVNGVTPNPAVPTLTVTLATSPFCTTSGTTTTCTINYTVPISTSVTIQIATYDANGNALGVGFVSVDTTQATIPPTNVGIGGFPAKAKFTVTSMSVPSGGSTTPASFTAALQVYDGEGNLLIPPSTYGGPITLAVTNDPNGSIALSSTQLTAPASVTNASNNVGFSFTSSKGLPATANITASFNGTLLATLPVTALTYTPSSLTNLVIGGASGSVTVSEAGYSGAFAVTGNGSNLTYTCSPANCTPASPGGAVTFSFKPAATGTGTLTFSDSSGGQAPVGFAVAGQSGGTINVANYAVDLYSTPDSSSTPLAITAGPDGKSVWFAEFGTPNFVRIDTTSCTATSCTMETEAPNPPGPINGLASGNDGNVYASVATSGSTGTIESIWSGFNPGCVNTSTMTCTIQPVSIPTAAPFPQQVVRGNDGNILIVDTAGSNNNIWSLNPITSAVTSPICCPSASWGFSGVAPGITPGSWWEIDNSTNMVGTMYQSCSDCGLSLTEAGTFSTGSGSTFGGIASGYDGSMWVTEQAANKIAYFNPTACNFTTPPLSCTVTEIPIPTASALAGQIIAGPDGNMWFSEIATGKIGIVTGCPSACKIQELTVAPAASAVYGLAVGPDGNVWFTLAHSSQVGKVVP